MRTMTVAPRIEKEQRLDLGKREAESLRALDELNAFQNVITIAPDRTVCSSGLVQQLEPLVIANGFDADAAGPGELADGHRRGLIHELTPYRGTDFRIHHRDKTTQRTTPDKS